MAFIIKNTLNTIECLGLKPRDRVVLDCYMAGMTCNEIAEFLDISRITVWRRRTRAQVKYKTILNYINSYMPLPF